MNAAEKRRAFKTGFFDGLPIGLGYISVSFTFGMMAVEKGMPAWAAILISFTNLTSAGQFAGLDVIAASGSMIEMALVQLVINLRYALMSLSWSQRLDPEFNLVKRMIIAYADTDEVFAVSSARAVGGKRLRFVYMVGLMIMPVIGWTGGTVIGALASAILPDAVRSALGLAIYGMFIAIIVPPARDHRSVAIVVLSAVAVSCLFHFAPVLKRLSTGFVIIICGVGASALGAWLFPVPEPDADTPDLEERSPHEC
ncbi:AzlC family ABC transporter permease [Pseudoramibacter sp.]|uniref:AzlC family ABC transporter permease n=1 Tax=Pseudoramibacter sp. TaxID=2034862 RepID=UPI0025FA6A81|nr:AzlC family ABC transporter permease [Pseudoramibacter sp.]MCH4072186.1 AzlC family ABC transporter permease [Pseudoramibacter sp.]MCH4105956.1 AzlC family ABC transporter permease [Pseudoramibacter sp.]